MKIPTIRDLRKAAYKLHYRTEFQGLPISVENRKGSKRHWTDHETGETGSTTMQYPYGYVRGTLGSDGDAVDVFLGPNKNSDKVFVVNQRSRGDNYRTFDEHKCMLGFDSKDAACAAYLRHYDSDKFLGAVTEMSMERFKRWLANGKKKDSPVYKAEPRFFKAKSSAQRPSGGGWQPIPKGRKGGYRRRRGKDWEYWYPEAQRMAQKRTSAERSKPKAPFTERQFEAGKFDTDPKNWHVWHSMGEGMAPVGWTAGGVDIESAHPVKVAGTEHKLYQIVDPQHEPDWAMLRDIATGETRVFAHPRVYPVFYDKNKRVRPIPEPAGFTHWEPGEQKQEPTTRVTRRKLPRYQESTAKPGTALHRIERGNIFVREITAWEPDADGKPTRVKKTAPYVEDSIKVKLISEFEGMLVNAAKRARNLMGLKASPETMRDLKHAALEGFLHAIETYPGGISFAKHAQFVSRDYARLQAAREYAGGISLPRAHARLMAKFIAARAQARKASGNMDPPPEVVARHWRIKKRDLHSGTYGSAQGNEPVPLGPYKLKAERIVVAGKKRWTTREPRQQPGKLEWARRYHSFLNGEVTSQGSDFFEQDALLFPAIHIGAGLSVEEKVMIRNSMDKVLATLRDHEFTVKGTRKTITYRTDAAAIVERALGLTTDAESAKTIAGSVVIERKTAAGDWKPLAQRQSETLVQDVLDHSLRKLSEAMGESRSTEQASQLVDRARQNLVPPDVVPPGPTYNEIIKKRAKDVTAEQIDQWRANERERLERLEAKFRGQIETAREDDHERLLELANGAAQARRRIERMGKKEIAVRVARQLAPETAEMRRLATKTVEVEPSSPGYSYGWAVTTMTDLATGRQRKVRVRTFRDLRDPETREQILPGTILQKAEQEQLTAGLLADVLQWPRLMALLWGNDDVAGAPTTERFVLESMLDMI